MSFLPVEKQEDGFNYGAFSIAYAAMILNENSPIDVRVDVPVMRNYLISWQVERDLWPFPKVKQDNT